MILQRLRIQNIRNHRLTLLDCPKNITLLWGENGAGKTSVLEAIALLCTTRSFVNKQDRTLINIEENEFSVEGAFLSDSDSRHTVSILYPGKTGRKQILLDNAPLESSPDLIGRFPLVVLSPQHRAISSGSPAERRSFMDFIISQVSHQYLLDLLEYRRILKQRNALLAESNQSSGRLYRLLDPWNQALAEYAVKIVKKRLLFLEDFYSHFSKAIIEISGKKEECSISYYKSLLLDYFSGSAAHEFVVALEHNIEVDLRRNTTTIGPHRDDLEISLNGIEARTQASQGQHKTILVALKIGECYYLKNHLDEAPIILFDDIFSEVDDERLSRIVEITHSLGQVFITTTNHSIMQHFTESALENGLFHVENGMVIQGIAIV